MTNQNVRGSGPLVPEVFSGKPVLKDPKKFHAFCQLETFLFNAVLIYGSKSQVIDLNMSQDRNNL